MDQWMGNLFSRRVQPSEIEGMDYHVLKYWNGWHELMAREERKVADNMKGRNA